MNGLFALDSKKVGGFLPKDKSENTFINMFVLKDKHKDKTF